MDNAAHARIDRWKQFLLEAADRLLDAGDHGIAIPGDPVRLVFSLVSGGRQVVEPDDVAALDADRVHAADGEHVLWLAIGALAWRDGERPLTSPIVLWPVQLERDGAGITWLIAAKAAPRTNDVLAARAGIELADDGALDVMRVLDRATAIAAERGWRVERTARLGTFAFAPHDLSRNLGELDAPAVRWLAGDGAPPPIAPAAGELVAPLDADASQLAVLAAALGGASFVVQGAPGTGKTQTIANLVACCASRGTSLLVVAEHQDALDAIARRLDAAGLAELVGAGRGSRPLLVPPSGPTSGAARLADSATRLERHVTAMHGAHGLGMSIHDALARLVELRTTPNAALEEPGIEALDRAAFEQKQRAAIELGEAAAAVEPVAAHPWRTAAPGAWRDDLVARADNALDLAGEAATELASAIAAMTTLVPHLATRTAEHLAAVGRLAEVAAASPRPGAELLAAGRARTTDDIGERIALIRARGGGAIEAPRDPAAFVAIASRHRTLAAEVSESFYDPDALDARDLWSQLKRWTTSMAPVRFVALRAVRAAVTAAALPGASLSDEAMLIALEAVLAERACRKALEAAAEPARRWFGALLPRAGALAAADFDRVVDRLEAALGWAAELRRAFEHAGIAGGDLARQGAWRALVAQVTVATTTDRADLVPFARLADAVGRYQPALAALAETAGIPLAQLGAGRDHLSVVRVQVDALVAALDALPAWTRYHLARRAAAEAGLHAAVAAVERGDLAAADIAPAWERATLLAWVAAAIARAPELVRFDGAAHHLAVTSFCDLDRGGMAVAKNRIPRASACTLATPAQLARGAACRFDLVVIAGAEQMPAAHALGALGRATAAIVVGDVYQPGVADSALAAALAAGWPAAQLTAQHASHHELFAFANGRYYGDRITAWPAARRGRALTWRQIAGVPDALGANRVEADAIAAEVVERLAAPGAPRIAVACLSRAQQELIEARLSAARVSQRVLVATPDRLREMFDVVLVSIADAADALGALAESHLAALATHARDALVLFSSFAPEAIAADAPSAWRGIAELIALARDGERPAGELPVSPVTAAIARALAERGWTLRHDLGSIELAVVDPDDPSRMVLAIEHDGSVYASIAATRDRERLHAQELARLGWRVHRVWTLDWWLDPERETARAHGAIVAAIAAGRRARALTPVPASAKIVAKPAIAAKAVRRRKTTVDALVDAPVDAAAQSAPLATGSGPLHVPRGAIAIGPYIAAGIPPGRRVPVDMFGERHQGELVKLVEQVLAAEAPIHLELLAKRVGAYFGVGRPSPEVIARVRALLAGRGRFGEEPDVVWRADQDPAAVPAVRVAGASAVACRDIAQIPLFEIAAAARIVVERAPGIAEDKLERETSRLLGVTRVTDRVMARIRDGIRLAAARELIDLAGSHAQVVAA